MKTYHSLSKLKFLKKYSYKFLFIAFLGIHVPLLGIIFYTLFVSEVSTTAVVLIVLAFTLGAAVLTLYILNNLLSPINEGKMALRNFVENNTVPNLPITYDDEVGQVLKNIQFTIETLDAVNKEKEEITELISHDLKTPVNQTLSIIELLKEEGSDPIQREEYLDLLHSVVTKQKMFLEEMLRMLKSKSVEINPSSYDKVEITEMINAIIVNHKRHLEAKNLVVINNLPKELCIHGHLQSLKEVISNLLSNAIKFSNVNDKIVFEGENNHDNVMVEIKDFGIGFREDTKAALFKKFIPGHLGTSGETSTGLGLYISKRIIDKHKGTLVAHSDGINKGATFTICLRKN